MGSLDVQKKHQTIHQNPNFQGNLSGVGDKRAPKNNSCEIFQSEIGGEQQ